MANDNAPLGGDDGGGGEVHPELAEWTPLAVVTGAGGGASLSWVHGNHLGVPLLYADGSGAQVTPAAHTMPGLPGQLRTLADLYYNRHRDYDSSTGRYIQADPIGLEGGANAYLYAEANPLRYVDPDGKVALALPALATSGGGVAAFCVSSPVGWAICGGAAAAAVVYTGYKLSQDWCDESVVMAMAKGGKKNIKNEITRDLIASREPNPCKVLREMRLQETDPVVLRKIKEAEKHFNCDKRNRFQ